MSTTMIVAGILLLQAGAQPPADRTEIEIASHVDDVLHAADEATKRVESVRYDAVFEGTGSQATRMPVIEGTVIVAKTERRNPHVRVEGTQFSVDELQGVRRAFSGAMFKGMPYRIDHESRIVIRGGGGLRTLGPGFSLILNEFNHPNPFGEEINATRKVLEGRAYVKHVLCDVVLVQYDTGTRYRWYFGAEDHLPRRVERLRTFRDEPGALVLTLANLEVNQTLAEDAFVIETPSGYQVKMAAPGSGIGGVGARRVPPDDDEP